MSNRTMKRSMTLVFLFVAGVVIYRTSQQVLIRNLTFDDVRESIDKVNMIRNVTRRRYNVLFLMADDLRAQLGPYESVTNQTFPTLHTPHFDALASKSLVFQRAFVQYSLCGPSRTSILTGRRPDLTRVFDNNHYWRKTGGNFTTLPQYFKDNGYVSVGVGKIFHRGLSSNRYDPISWSEPFSNIHCRSEKHYMDSELGWRAVTDDEVAEVPLADQQALDITIRNLERFAQKAISGEQPFFLAHGFMKPHLAMICPKKYFDLYDIMSVRKDADRYLVDDSWKSPKAKFSLGSSKSIELLPFESLLEYRRAYFACISYIDSLLGKLLKALKDLNLADSTIISFVADHGYHLGENAAFGKQTLHDPSTHVPMMIRVPGTTDGGLVSETVVETLDLFPTIISAAGLGNVPHCPINSSSTSFCTQGKFHTRLLTGEEQSLSNATALSQLQVGANQMQYSIRTDRFRYTVLSERGASIPVLQPGSEVYPPELYDHMTDPRERVNVVNDPVYADIRQELHVTLDRLLKS